MISSLALVAFVAGCTSKIKTEQDCTKESCAPKAAEESAEESRVDGTTDASGSTPPTPPVPSPTQTLEPRPVDLPGTAGHWREVFSVGRRTDRKNTPLAEVGFVAERCGGTVDCIRIAWTPFTVTNGTIDGYRIHRRAEGESFDFSEPLAVIDEVAAEDLYYIDVSPDLVPGQFYYYLVEASVGRDFVRGTPPMAPVRILKPESNLAFVHRGMVNSEICGLMGRGVGAAKGSDPMQDYRCQFAGFGHKVVDGEKVYDLGKDLVVDRFENGCNYTAEACAAHDPGDGSSTTDCFGKDSPNGAVSAAKDAVFFARDSQRCWVNTSVGSGTTWTVLADVADDATRRLMATNAGATPLITGVSATQNAAFCATRQIAAGGGTVSMRMPRKSEFIAYAAWSDLDAAPTIEFNGGVDGSCNTDHGHGLTYDWAYPGPNSDLLAGDSTAKYFSSGSIGSRQCVSRYGVQDAVGNAYEWTSDELQSGVGKVSSLDPDNSDFVGLSLTAPVIGVPQVNKQLSDFPYYSVTLGMPLTCSTLGTDPDAPCHGDDALVLSTKLSPSGDMVWLVSNALTRGSLAGGLFADGASAGRFRVAFDQSTIHAFSAATIRCVAELPP